MGQAIGVKDEATTTVGLVLHTIARRSQEFDFKLRSLFDELSHQTQRTDECRSRPVILFGFNVA